MIAIGYEYRFGEISKEKKIYVRWEEEEYFNIS